MQSKIVGLMAASLALGACGGGSRAVQINPQDQVIGTRWNATLSTPAALAGATQVKGTGWMAADERGEPRTRAHVEIANAVPGGEHPWHVHLGQCGNDQGILGSADAYRPLRVGGDGTAQEEAELNIPVPRSGQYHINVHASPNNMATIIACGNLAPPTR